VINSPPGCSQLDQACAHFFLMAGSIAQKNLHSKTEHSERKQAKEFSMPSSHFAWARLKHSDMQVNCAENVSAVRRFLAVQGK